MIYGSSRISILGATAATGPTGSVGPTGSSGPTGAGVRGSTGNTGIGISFIDNYLNSGIIGTSFDDGSFSLSSFVVKGPTGPAIIGITNAHAARVK